MKQIISLLFLLPVFTAASPGSLLQSAKAEQLQPGVGEIKLATYQGLPALQLTGKTPPKQPNHNTYLKFRFQLQQPINMNGKALRFTVHSQTFARYGGVIVNLFNQGENQPAWSLMRWDGALFRPEPVLFNIAAGENRTLI